MNNLQNIALNIINQNPNVKRNPRAQEMIQIIQNGDAAKGRAIAENLCRTYGTTKEDAISSAMRFFGFR